MLISFSKEGFVFQILTNDFLKVHIHMYFSKVIEVKNGIKCMVKVLKIITVITP